MTSSIFSKLQYAVILSSFVFLLLKNDSKLGLEQIPSSFSAGIYQINAGASEYTITDGNTEWYLAKEYGIKSYNAFFSWTQSWWSFETPNLSASLDINHPPTIMAWNELSDITKLFYQELYYFGDLSCSGNSIEFNGGGTNYSIQFKHDESHTSELQKIINIDSTSNNYLVLIHEFIHALLIEENNNDSDHSTIPLPGTICDYFSVFYPHAPGIMFDFEFFDLCILQNSGIVDNQLYFPLLPDIYSSSSSGITKFSTTFEYLYTYFPYAMENSKNHCFRFDSGQPLYDSFDEIEKKYGLTKEEYRKMLEAMAPISMIFAGDKRYIEKLKNKQNKQVIQSLEFLLQGNNFDKYAGSFFKMKFDNEYTFIKEALKKDLKMKKDEYIEKNLKDIKRRFYRNSQQYLN